MCLRGEAHDEVAFRGTESDTETRHRLHRFFHLIGARIDDPSRINLHVKGKIGGRTRARWWLVAARSTAMVAHHPLSSSGQHFVIEKREKK